MLAGINTSFAVAFLIGFMLCEIVNGLLRERWCSRSTFAETVLVSFPICVVPPVAGVILGRLVLPTIGLAGDGALITTTILISVPLCVLGTSLVIQREHH